MVKSCNGDTRAVATLLMTEKIEQIVSMQVEAIKNIKIDKVTVWDSAGGHGDGGSSTSNFLSSLVRSIPRCRTLSGWRAWSCRAIWGR